MHPQFETCPIHDEPTNYIQNAKPDEDWNERAKALYLEKVEEESRPPIPKATGPVPITEEDGLLYVSQSDLWRAGVRLSRAHSSFHLFELDGFIYETQGWQESKRRWWVEKVSDAIKLPDAVPEERPKKKRLGKK